MSAPRLPETPMGRLVFALKPASWPKLLVPALLGHALGVDATGSLSAPAFFAGLLIVVLDIVFIVCLNDWGDQRVDALKRRMFPESSPKTVPDGVLGAQTLLFLGLAAGAGALAVAAIAAPLLNRPHLVPLTLAALATFWLYSLPPIRLNYRGGGEVLEALGVGVLLPVLSCDLQSGALFPPSATMLFGFALLALASAIASGLSDERSDLQGGKRTFVTMLGNARARRTIEALALFGPVLWLVLALFLAGGPPRIVAIIAALTALDEWWTLRQRSNLAVTDAFGALRQYKDALHALIWRSGIAWALGLFVAPWLGM